MRVILDHIVLNVSDLPSAVSFYENVLNLKIERLDKYEKGFVPFPSVRLSEESLIDLFPPEMWKTEGADGGTEKINVNHFCLTFDEPDWRELLVRLKEHGVEIERFDDNNWGAKGGGVSVYFRDPDGNQIEARYYRDN